MEQISNIHVLTYPDTDSAAYAKARYHYLLQIIFGETIATNYCRTMSTFAPTAEARDFLLKQQTEEDMHLELLTDYVGLHPRPEVLISPSLKKLDAIMSEAIRQKDYAASVFMQNFIVEGLNISLLRELEHHSDSNLSELSKRILRDEIGHMEFGIREIRRILGENPNKELVTKLVRLQRATLFHATMLSADLAREAKDLGIPMGEFTKRTISEHCQRIRSVNFPLSFVDRLFFFLARRFLSLL